MERNPRTPSTEVALVEGIDYYIENGLWVFTAKYHLARGSCCGSGCRHCPYGNTECGIRNAELKSESEGE
jgi:hypothetical protein